MPGFTIHLAVAKEYEKKHKDEIKKEADFIQGVLAPDLLSIKNKEDKTITHYGKRKEGRLEIQLKEFIDTTTIDLVSDYGKGYFLHLLTDYYFYTQDFKQETDDTIQKETTFYHDYDCLNQELLETYQIEVLPEIAKYMAIIKDKPEFLKPQKVNEFIEKMAKLDLEEEKKEAEGE